WGLAERWGGAASVVMIPEYLDSLTRLCRGGWRVGIQEPRQRLMGTHRLALRRGSAREPADRHGPLRGKIDLNGPDPPLTQLVERRGVIRQEFFRCPIFADCSFQDLLSISAIFVR